MLATLYAKALDADLPDPILGDRYAKDIVERIDYDWAKTAITARNSPSVTTRTAHLDTWAREFLAAHSSAVVLHVGCGLDTRYFRLQPGPHVDWYDVDHPEVATLCTQLFPVADHHRVVAASVTDPAWLAEIPNDRPALMIAEGLTMYLSEQDGVALLRRVVDRFPRGELQFDAFNRLGIKSQWINTVVRRSGIEAALGHRRARRNPRGGPRHPAALLGALVRIGHLRAAVARLPSGGQAHVAGSGLRQHGAIPPLRIRTCLIGKRWAWAVVARFIRV